MGVLKAKVGGVWEDVSTTVTVPGVVPDEMSIGPNDPGDGVELWFDTDAVGAAAGARWGAPGAGDRPVQDAALDPT